MADEPEAPVDDQQAAASFAAGFDEDAAPPVVAPAPAPEVVAEQPTPAPAPAPEFVQITKEDYTRLMNTVEETARVRRGLDSLAGTVGNHHKAIDQFKHQTPAAGVKVEITEDDLAEMKEDYPDLAGSTVAGLRRIFAKMQATGTGAPATVVRHDPEEARIEAAKIVHQEGLRDLDDMHPGWRQLVGMPGEDNAYRRWLGTQPPEYQDLVKSTYSASITARSIERFKSAGQATRPRTQAPADSRRAVIQGAVTPRGTGHAPAPRQPTPEDNFNAGFNS